MHILNVYNILNQNNIKKNIIKTYDKQGKKLNVFIKCIVCKCNTTCV